jgi:PX domain
MAASASVFAGTLTRTWHYATSPERTHVISLYHDTITGTRSLLVDWEEVEGSSGNSSLIMSNPHRLCFDLEGKSGYVEIRKNGLMGFAYLCKFDDEVIAENTTVVSTQQEDTFQSRIVSFELTPDDAGTNSIVWYKIEARRLKDGVENAVHRRFRDFVDLHENIKQNLKGNHLYSSLPSLPDKTLKIGSNVAVHSDPAFIQARLSKLDSYLSALIRVPHVADMVALRAFLGILECVREYSVVYRSSQLGITLQRTSIPPAHESAVVGSVQETVTETEEIGVKVGDAVSKLNGVAVEDLNFSGTIARIRRLPRPFVVHFTQVFARRGGPGGPASPSSAAVVDRISTSPPPAEEGDLLGLRDEAF